MIGSDLTGVCIIFGVSVYAAWILDAGGCIQRQNSGEEKRFIWKTQPSSVCVFGRSFCPRGMRRAPLTLSSLLPFLLSFSPTVFLERERAALSQFGKCLHMRLCLCLSVCVCVCVSECVAATAWERRTPEKLQTGRQTHLSWVKIPPPAATHTHARAHAHINHNMFYPR